MKREVRRAINRSRGGSDRFPGLLQFMKGMANSTQTVSETMIEQEDEENPYAPPKVHEVRPVERPGLAWRDGQMLMVRKGAELPDRCLKCNASAEGYRFKRSLTWLSPYWAILILVCGPIPFAIIYLCLCARGKLTAGLCPVHRTSRRRAIAIGWLTVLLGVGSMIVAGFLSDAHNSEQRHTVRHSFWDHPCDRRFARRRDRRRYSFRAESTSILSG